MKLMGSCSLTGLVVKLLVLVVFYQTIHQACAFSDLSFEFSLSSQILVAEKLKENFFKSNLFKHGVEISESDVSSSLREFQNKILELRNSECSDSKEETSRFERLNSSLAWKKTSESWAALEKSIHSGQKIESELNNIASSLNEMCVDSTTLMRIFNSSTDGDALSNYENVFQLVLTQLNNKGCDFCRSGKKESAPSQLETWGFGFLLVTIISCSSLCGAALIPFTKTMFYKKLLLFLIAVAVGSLAGSGFIHLIPQAFDITEDKKYAENHLYVWKGLVMMGGVYLFYIVEKGLKIMVHRQKVLRKSTSSNNDLCRHNSEEDATIPSEVKNSQILSIELPQPQVKSTELGIELEENLDKQVLSQSIEKEVNNLKLAPKKGHQGYFNFMGNLSSVEPVAWMIIFGDALHNFIDGLSIGAAFTDSVMQGVSISLAVICEEFPHELGDFAILINAGMSFKMALFFNLLSACSCYIGLAVGIVVGGNLDANQWIYAIAGGMFLYIALCDMIPELNDLGDEIESESLEEAKTNSSNDEERALSNQEFRKLEEPLNLKLKFKIFVIQNLGIIFGFSFMLIMAIYAKDIRL